MAERLELPEPFDAGELLARIGRQRGRDIELVPVASRPHLPCGLLLSTGGADYVLYAADTTPLHREHILVHEAAHLLFDHAGSAPLTPVASQAILPHLPTDLVRRVLGRTGYDEPQEREAELLASLIMSRVARAGTTSPRPARPLSIDVFFAPPPDQDDRD
ncbi:hypothetical protein [Streptantibioticus cattleyicolor]|nr:hypothetical protein [Streptantibioticus cattleyicolor]CCB71289.1 conserved protein of unknown function [Streptantibioticus cattleyicolor NRRL 8057 = DSM 46488]